MSSHSEADAYLQGLNAPVRRLATSSHEVFVAEGCSSYVKTIYVGYDFGGEMVAALYGHSDHVEVALALPEDAHGQLLVDASHLTWRTLPVAAIVRTDDDVAELTELISLACRRVREREHSVVRDNDFFIRSRRQRRGTAAQ
jgi:alpha/beta superfamily hydrolase